MHVPQDLMWHEILKTFCISGWTKHSLKFSRCATDDDGTRSIRGVYDIRRRGHCLTGPPSQPFRSHGLGGVALRLRTLASCRVKCGASVLFPWRQHESHVCRSPHDGSHTIINTNTHILVRIDLHLGTACVPVTHAGWVERRAVTTWHHRLHTFIT